MFEAAHGGTLFLDEIGELPLDVPALRERREDIPPLVEHFLRQLAATHHDPRLPDDFAARAQRHAWPGNVREPRNAVERAVLLPNHPTLGFEAPPKRITSPSCAAF